MYRPRFPISKPGPLTITQSTSVAPAWSPLNGKPVLLNFDGAEMSSDAGLSLLREVERRTDLAGLVAKCLPDPRAPGKVRHSLEDIIRVRIMMIAAGYEDGNDADDLRADPAFKRALERDPETGAALCSQPTISRMENLADTRALIGMAHEMVRFYCASFARAPRQIVLDIDDTFDTTHGHQQLRLFNAYYDEYGFQPILVERSTRHCPRRGGPLGTRYPLHRDQSDGPARQASLREDLFRPWASREPYQGLENPPRLGQNVVLKGKRQSDATDAARLCLLAVVDTARGLPKALPMAARTVRHVASPSGQTGRDRRREENPDHHDAAGLLPASEPHRAAVQRARAATPGMTQTHPAHPEPSTLKAPDDTAVRR